MKGQAVTQTVPGSLAPFIESQHILSWKDP